MFLSSEAEALMTPVAVPQPSCREQPSGRSVALWTAVLEDALRLVQHDRFSGDMRFKEDRLEAVEWFASDDYHIGSFLWVCDVLDRSPSSIRNVVRRLRQGTVRITLRVIRQELTGQPQ